MEDQNFNPTSTSLLNGESQNSDFVYDNLTRLAAAGAVIYGKSYRQNVVNRYGHPYRAIAPEIGLDVEIVLRVCSHIEEETKGNKYLGIVYIVAFLLVFTGPGIIISIILFIWAASQSTNEMKVRDKYIEYFRAGKYDPEVIKRVFTKSDSDIPKRIPNSNQNIVVYGGFQPFIGAGQLLRNWSFPVDIGRYFDDDGDLVQPDEFELSELYDLIIEKIDELQFENIKVRDYLFTFGSDIRQEETILSSPLSAPKQQANSEMIRKHMNSTDSTIRYYKWISLYDWDGEIVLSFFLRFSKRGSRTLFIEMNTYILTPLLERLHDVDREEEKSGCLRMSSAAANYRRSQQQALQQAARQSVQTFTSKMLDDIRDEVSLNPRYNYGVSSSLREYISARKFTRYFQYMDKEMYVKIFDRLILQVIETFLQDHHINVEMFRASKSVVINNGIIGDVNADNLAVGEGSEATTNQSQGLAGVVQQFTGQSKASV